MNKQWRIIESGTLSAAWNMAIDEALLRRFKEGDTPIVRLYHWEEPSLSFGRLSRATETLQWERVREGAIPYVRRITGGGILVHGNDLSYALIVPRRFIAQQGVKTSYRLLCSFLIRLYRGLGLDAAFAQACRLTTRPAAACLAGREAYDIVIDGKKIGGNAQHHTHHAMLQHGTIPLSIPRPLFEPLFREASGLDESMTLEGLGLDTTTLRSRLFDAFAESFDANLLESELNDDEKAYAQTLYEYKYTKESWNVHAQSPTL
jgi:lipoate-protein ligase A